MKRFLNILLLAVIIQLLYISCKKDITPTKSNLMIGSIDYSFGSQNSVNHSNYDFEYSENKILKKVYLEGLLSLRAHGNGPFVFTTKYVSNVFELDKNIGQGETGLDFNDEDQKLELNNLGKIISSVIKTGFRSPEFGVFTDPFPKNFTYLNGKLKTVHSAGYYDSITNFIFDTKNMISFIDFRLSRFRTTGFLLDSTINYTLGYQTTTPDTSVIKVNGINNLILCIPFEVQETLPFLVVDERLSLTGKKQNYLINSISVEEKRGGITQKTTTYTINYLYDTEGRIIHVQWINNATLAIYREAVIGYL